jgi:asparagine synthase (glutamine-hydrolysing)
VAFQEFLSTGVIYEDRTLFREVRKLPPASVLTFAEGRLQTSRRYWTMSDVALESRDRPEAVQALGDSLFAVVRDIGQRFSQPVCDLTGGYDSRALVAGLVTAGVSFSTTVSGPPASHDVVVSRELARMLNLPHQHIQPKPLQSFDELNEAFTFTDGEYDLVDYARVLAVHRTLSERFKISLNGSFGEVARGYWWELLFPHAGERRALDANKLARLRYAGHGFDPSLTAPADRLSLVDHFAGVVERTNAGLTGLTNTAQMDHAYLMMRMQRWQGRIASSTNQLWPVLSPFLARSVLERMLEAKVSLRRRSLLTREMLLRYQPRLAAFPLEHGYPAVPVSWRTIHRFWPLPLDLGKRAINKLARKAGWQRQVRGEPPYNVRARLALWKDERVRRLLDPADMRLSSLLVHPPLIKFLDQSRQEGFAFTDQWCRVLTLEHTLRAAEKTKADIAAAGAQVRT